MRALAWDPLSAIFDVVRDNRMGGMQTSFGVSYQNMCVYGVKLLIPCILLWVRQV